MAVIYPVKWGGTTPTIAFPSADTATITNGSEGDSITFTDTNNSIGALVSVNASDGGGSPGVTGNPVGVQRILGIRLR